MLLRLNLRELWRGFAVGVAFLVMCVPVFGQDQPIRTQTFTYKTVGDLEIKANVHRLDDDVVRPVVIFIHGGGLIMGGRLPGRSVSTRNDWLGRVTRMMLAAGYAVVSIDHRLAPETKLPAIVEDVEDAFTWVRTEGPKLFNVETSKIVVMGGSAGGYLALTAGFRTQPRPAVLVVFWAYGNPAADWLTQPRPTSGVNVTEEEVHRQVSGPPIANSRDREANGSVFFQYVQQHGLWPEAVSGWDPHTEAEKFHPFTPVRNVTADYPPTMLIHGTGDTEAPYEQSVLMAEQLEKHGVEYELVTIPGGGHYGLAGGDPQLIDKAYDDMLAWLNLFIPAAAFSQNVSYHLLDVESIGIPTRGYVSSEFLGIRDLMLWDGRIYIGHGDGTVNTGPTEILSFDPTSNEVVNEFVTDENAIIDFRVLDGQLVIPGRDCRTSERGSIYVLTQDGWTQRSSIPSTNHLLDATVFKNKWYVSTGGTFFQFDDGQRYRIGTVMESPDSGETFTLSFSTPISMPSDPTQYRVGSLAVFKDRLYGFPFHIDRMRLDEIPEQFRAGLGDVSNLSSSYHYLLYTPDTFGDMDAVVYDRAQWTFADLVPEKNISLISGNVFKDHLLLVALTGRYLHVDRLKRKFPPQARTDLYTFDGERSRSVSYGGGNIRDIMVRNDRLYLLIWKDDLRLIAETEDLETWTYHVLPDLMQGARTLEFDGESFYIGMNDGNLFRSLGSRPIASLDEVRGTAPRSFYGVADVPRQGRWYWSVLTAWRDWGVPARVHARLESGNLVQVTVDNVSGFLLFSSSAGVESARPVEILINGQLAFEGNTAGVSALQANLGSEGAWEVQPVNVSRDTYRPSKRIIGVVETELTLDGEQPSAARWKAEVYRWATGADVAFAHQWGGRRFRLQPGDLSLHTLYDRLKTDSVYTFRLTGRELRSMIEFNIRHDRSWWHVSLAGVRATFELHDDPSGNRIIEWNLDDDSTYSVAGDLHERGIMEGTFGSVPEYEDTGLSSFSAAVRWFEAHHQVRDTPSQIRIVERR